MCGPGREYSCKKFAVLVPAFEMYMEKIQFAAMKWVRRVSHASSMKLSDAVGVCMFTFTT
jgi:hypothetical protein